MIKMKPKMISDDTADFVFKCGKIWKNYVAGNAVVVVTEHPVEKANLFGDYAEVIQKGVDKGLVTMLTLAQVEAQHLEQIIVEF